MLRCRPPASRASRGVGAHQTAGGLYWSSQVVIAADVEPMWRAVFIIILLLVAVDAIFFDWKYFDLFTRMIGEIARSFGY